MFSPQQDARAFACKRLHYGKEVSWLMVLCRTKFMCPSTNKKNAATSVTFPFFFFHRCQEKGRKKTSGQSYREGRMSYNSDGSPIHSSVHPSIHPSILLPHSALSVFHLRPDMPNCSQLAFSPSPFLLPSIPLPHPHPLSSFFLPSPLSVCCVN